MIRNFLTKQCCAAVAILAFTGSAMAQHAHSDVEFGYADGKIDIEFDPIEGQVFESEFPTDVLLTEQYTDDPGFASEPAEGLGITPNHVIKYNILGPLAYHDGNGFATVPTGVYIDILGNLGSGNFLVTDSTAPTSSAGTIGLSDGTGEVHEHIEFTLQPGAYDLGNNPPVGAYGLLMSLSSFNSDGVTPSGIADSDQFYIVFNFGLEEDELEPGPHFHDAVEDFAAAVPEPGSAVALLVGAGLIASRRRRK